MATQRKFRPKKKFPKQELINFLEQGLTLQEIASHYGVAVSYISEYLKMLNINLDDFKGRRHKIKQRQDIKKQSRNTFFDCFYELIKGEITHGR